MAGTYVCVFIAMRQCDRDAKQHETCVLLFFNENVVDFLKVFKIKR